MKAHARAGDRIKPDGLEVFIVESEWFDWDPDGECFYLMTAKPNHLICVDAATKQETNRVSVPHWDVHPLRFFLSQKGILYSDDTHLWMIEYKTLTHLWKIALPSRSCQIFAHPSHNFVITLRQEEAVFYNPDSGEIVKRITAEELETYTKGVLKRSLLGTKTAIDLTIALPPRCNYAPQGFVYLTSEDLHSRSKKINVEMRHLNEKEGKRFSGPLPDFFRQLKPHPTDPHRVLAYDSRRLWLSMVDAGAGSRGLPQ